MTQEQQFILDLLRQSLRPECSLLSRWKESEFDCESIVRIIIKHGILLTVYQTLSDFPKLKTALYDQYCTDFVQTVTQKIEGEQILSHLNIAGYDCMGLKGWEMRKYYPKGTMRQMADLDILVRPYDYRVLAGLMHELGYTSDGESSWKHDSFVKDDIKVEMHKRLTDDSSRIRDWEQSIWERAVPCEAGEHIFRMRDEDWFLFHIIHMQKDFMNGALGLRRIADTWLFENEHPDMDRNYLNGEFDRMGLRLFAERMSVLGKAAMGVAEMDGNSEIMLEHAFRYGIYSGGKTYKLGRIASMSDSLTGGKFRSLFKAVFLPYSRMKAHFPLLEKWPVLLPWYWLIRIFQNLKGNLKKKRKMLDYRGLKEEDFAEMKEFFKAGGIKQ